MDQSRYGVQFVACFYQASLFKGSADATTFGKDLRPFYIQLGKQLHTTTEDGMNLQRRIDTPDLGLIISFLASFIRLDFATFFRYFTSF